MAEAPVCSRHGSPRSDATLRDIQINLLECKVCFEKFSTEQREYRPQNLSCGHVLCLECVRVLSHPLLRTLECPFCRQTCAVDSISHCQALTDLQEMLLSRSSQALVPHQVRADSSSWVRGLSSGALHLGLVFGGWGTLINPTGIAVFGSSGTMVVVQDGDSSVVVFGPQGRRLHSFGQRGHAQDKICYPVDVAVTPTGYVVVTDAGDSAVKVYTSRGSPVLTVRECFQLPWGVDVDSCGHILVTDLQTGSLHQVTVDIGRGVTLSNRAVVTELQRPKAVACCRVTGNIAVVEQLDNPSQPTRGCRSTRLKVYNKDFKLFCQIDSFSLSLDSKVWLCLSAVAFDINGDVIVIDSLQDMIWSLGKLKSGPILTPLIRENLVRPVGLVATAQNSLIILDSGDHSVKMYSPISETTLAIKLTTMSSMHS